VRVQLTPAGQHGLPRRALRRQFDRIFLRRTGFVTLDRLLKRFTAFQQPSC
jgi:hypothetical protein